MSVNESSQSTPKHFHAELLKVSEEAQNSSQTHKSTTTIVATEALKGYSSSHTIKSHTGVNITSDVNSCISDISISDPQSQQIIEQKIADLKKSIKDLKIGRAKEIVITVAKIVTLTLLIPLIIPILSLIFHAPDWINHIKHIGNSIERLESDYKNIKRLNDPKYDYFLSKIFEFSPEHINKLLDTDDFEIYYKFLEKLNKYLELYSAATSENKKSIILDAKAFTYNAIMNIDLGILNRISSMIKILPGGFGDFNQIPSERLMSGLAIYESEFNEYFIKKERIAINLKRDSANLNEYQNQKNEFIKICNSKIENLKIKIENLSSTESLEKNKLNECLETVTGMKMAVENTPFVPYINEKHRNAKSDGINIPQFYSYGPRTKPPFS